MHTHIPTVCVSHSLPKQLTNVECLKTVDLHPSADKAIVSFTKIHTYET